MELQVPDITCECLKPCQHRDSSTSRALIAELYKINTILDHVKRVTQSHPAVRWNIFTFDYCSTIASAVERNLDVELEWKLVGTYWSWSHPYQCPDGSWLCSRSRALLHPPNKPKDESKYWRAARESRAARGGLRERRNAKKPSPGKIREKRHGGDPGIA